MAPYCVWGYSKDKDIVFQSLTDATLDKALHLIRTCSFGYENVAKAVGLASEPEAIKELEALCLDAAKDGVSIVAVHVKSKEVVGVAFNKIQVSSEKNALQLFSENCKYNSSKSLVDFMIDMESKVDRFKYYGTDSILKIMFLGASPSSEACFMEELLLSWSIKMLKQLKKGSAVKTPVTVNDNNSIQNKKVLPTSVSAIMTSNYSQKVACKLGFEILAVVSFNDFSFAGKSFAERIGGEHQHSILVAMKLSSTIIPKRIINNLFIATVLCTLLFAILVGFSIVYPWWLYWYYHF